MTHFESDSEDDDKYMMALRKNVILRSPRGGHLEGRTLSIQRLC